MSKEMYQYAHAAAQSLQRSLLLNRRVPGLVYVLGDHAYSVLIFDEEGAYSCKNEQGKALLKTMREFIQGSHREQQCLGLVPLSGKVEQELQKEGLEIRIEGIDTGMDWIARLYSFPETREQKVILLSER